MQPAQTKLQSDENFLYHTKKSAPYFAVQIKRASEADNPKTSQEAFFLINHTKMYCKTWLACHHVKIDYTAFADLFACMILSD